jgi:hypothetical protein
MQYHIVLTERYNKRCTYCGGTRHVDGLPLVQQGLRHTTRHMITELEK